MTTTTRENPLKNQILNGALAGAFAVSLFATAAVAQTNELKLDHAQVENIVRWSAEGGLG